MTITITVDDVFIVLKWAGVFAAGAATATGAIFWWTARNVRLWP